MPWIPPKSLVDQEDRLREALREQIRRSGLSLRQLDRIIGWGTNYTSQVLRGGIDLRVMHVVAIAQAISVPMERLLLEVEADTLSPALIQLVDERVKAAIERTRLTPGTEAEKE